MAGGVALRTRTSARGAGTARDSLATRAFRALNDKLASSPAALTRVRQFVCECANPECGEVLEVSIAAYRRLRANPDQYLVAPAHRVAERTRVLERRRQYWVIEAISVIRRRAAASTVLVVDDDAGLRHLVSVSLGLAANQIVEASDGRQALGLARSSVPDLLLTDVDLPLLDGFQLGEAVRGDTLTSAIPIIFVSGQTNAAAVARAAALGALHYVTKPFDPAVLSEYVVAALERVGSTRSRVHPA